MTKQRKGKHFKDRDLMWFSAEIIFSKQQHKQMNTFCHINQVSCYSGEVTKKDSMKANELELKMETGSL